MQNYALWFDSKVHRILENSSLMDFDPLSLFSPKVTKGSDQYACNLENIDPEYNWLVSPEEMNKTAEMEMVLEQFDVETPLHILDLPSISMKPPSDVLLLILRLISLDEVWNFTQDDGSRQDPSKVFEKKNITQDLIEFCIPWLKQYCPRFDTAEKLRHLPNLCISLKKTNSYNEWLTRIISNDLKWMRAEERDTVKKEASLRISENCGRTAQPELIRKIKLHNMDRMAVDYITLKEPSLTSDNLGLKTWGSSLILSQKLIDDDSMLKEPILELGSGTGLVGIVCKLLGYDDIYMTDLKEIIPNLRDNLRLNGLKGHVDELDWSNPSEFCLKFPSLSFQTIILSDPIYSSTHPYLIKNVLSQFVGKETTVLIQVPIRRNFEDIRDLLWDLLDDDFELQHQEIETGPDEFGDIEYCFKKFVLKSIK